MKEANRHKREEDQTNGSGRHWCRGGSEQDSTTTTRAEKIMWRRHAKSLLKVIERQKDKG